MAVMTVKTPVTESVSMFITRAPGHGYMLVTKRIMRTLKEAAVR